MTLTDLRRVNDTMLADIARRLASPMNDEGLRAWYRQDVAALLEEVLSLRRDRAEAMRIFSSNPPLEGIEPSTDFAEVAGRLAALWIENQEGIWQRAEVKRIRENLATTKLALKTSEDRRASLESRLSSLQVRFNTLTDDLAQAHRAVDMVTAEAQKTMIAKQTELEHTIAELVETRGSATRAIAATRVDAEKRISAAAEEIRRAKAEITDLRDGVGQAMTATQHAYSERAESARKLLEEALRVL